MITRSAHESLLTRKQILDGFNKMNRIALKGHTAKR